MQRRRSVATATVLVSVTIAACLNYTTFSTTESAIVVNPAGGSVNFGNQPVNTTSGPQTIRFSPDGTGIDSNDSVFAVDQSCAAFTVTGPTPQEVSFVCNGGGTGTASGPSLKPGAPSASGSDPVPCEMPTVREAMFTATFHPTVGGPDSCTVNFQFSGTSGAQIISVTLNGNGVLPPSAIQVSPASVQIGDVQVTTGRAVAITMQNIGSTVITVNNVTANPLGPVFSLSGQTGTHTLVPGQQSIANIICTPNAEQMFNSTVTVNSNAANTPIVQVPVACRGIDSVLTANPGGPIDFDARHTEPLERMITLSNTGGAPSNITSLALTGNAELSLIPPTPPGAFTIPPGLTRDLRVRYTAATAVLAQTTLGNLAITHDAGEVDNITVTGRALPTSLGVSSDGVDFGGVCVNTMKEQEIKVFANALGAFLVTNVARPTAPFTLVGPSNGSVLGGHANDLIYMAQVRPTAPGARADKASVITNIPGGMPEVLDFKVEGLTAGVSATALTDFGVVEVDTTSTFRSVILTNCSGRDMTGLTLSIGGDFPDDFTIVGPATLKDPLVQTDTQEINVVMNPKAAGTRTATLIMTHSEGMTEAALTGNATGGEPPILPPDPSDSYYRCSTGGAGGPMLVGFVLLGVLLRRRKR